QAAGAAVTPFAPVEQLRALLEQRQTGLGECLAQMTLIRQFPGECSEPPPGFDGLVDTQTSADAADRCLRIDALNALAFACLTQLRLLRHRQLGQPHLLGVSNRQGDEIQEQGTDQELTHPHLTGPGSTGRLSPVRPRPWCWAAPAARVALQAGPPARSSSAADAPDRPRSP